jgi:hypothetical protein
MLYALLCYNDEATVWSWDKSQETEVMDRLAVVRGKLERERKLGPSLRLLPTTAATTLRKGREPIVLDGPFAETKEQLLGFYLLDCDSLEEALGAAKDLARASSSEGAYEVRPVMLYRPGTLAE